MPEPADFRSSRRTSSYLSAHCHYGPSLACGRSPDCGRRRRQPSRPHSRPAARIPTAAATRPRGAVGSCQCVHPPISRHSGCGQSEPVVQLTIGRQSAIGGGDHTATEPEHQAAVEMQPQRTPISLHPPGPHGFPVRSRIRCQISYESKQVLLKQDFIRRMPVQSNPDL